MTIPTPKNFKGEKMVKDVEKETVVVVPESKLGDGKLDSEDVKKVYVFASTNKKIIAAIVLFVAALVSGKGVDIAFQYLGVNTPSAEVQQDIDSVDDRLDSMQKKIDALLKKEGVVPPTVTPAVEPQPITMNFDPVPTDESNVPFTVQQDSTTDDGSSPIKTNVSFSVQSTEN